MALTVALRSKLPRGFTIDAECAAAGGWAGV